MANNRQVVSIGVQLDYQKSLDDMISNLRSELKKAKDSIKNLGVSDEMLSQISTLEKRLDVLADNLTNAFTALGKQDIDIQSLKKFQDELNGEISSIKKDITEVTSSVALLSSSLEGFKGVDFAQNIIADFNALKNVVENTNNTIQEFYKMCNKSKSSGVVRFSNSEVQEMESVAKSLKKEINSDETLPNIQKESTKKLEAMLQKELSVFDDIEESMFALEELGKERVSSYEEKMSVLSMQKEHSIARMENIARALYNAENKVGYVDEYAIKDRRRKNISETGKADLDSAIRQIKGSDYDSVYKKAEEDLEKLQSRIRKAKEEALASVTETGDKVEIGEFKIKEGKITVPIQIKVLQANRDKELESEIINTVQNLRRAIQKMPVWIDVKLRTANSDQKGISETSLTTQRAVKEYFQQTEDDVQSLGAEDFGNNFFRTFEQEAKAAANIAKVAVKEIQNALEVSKIDVELNGVKISPESLKEIKQQLTGLFSKTRADDFVKSFSEQFSNALKSNDFENALLTSLNSATDKWTKHFDNSLATIRKQLEPDGEVLETDKDKQQKIIEDEISKAKKNAIKQKKLAEKYKEGSENADEKTYLTSFAKQQKELMKISSLVNYAQKNSISLANVFSPEELSRIKPFDYYANELEKSYKKYQGVMKKITKKGKEIFEPINDENYLESLDLKTVKPQLDVNLEDIALWKATFVGDIKTVSEGLQERLTDAGAKSVEAWKAGMINAVDEVAKKLITALQTTDGLQELVNPNAKQTTSAVANNIAELTSVIDKFSGSVKEAQSNNTIKFDPTSINELRTSLNEILIILQRIHEESNIAFSGFGNGVKNVESIATKHSAVNIGEIINNEIEKYIKEVLNLHSVADKAKKEKDKNDFYEAKRKEYQAYGKLAALKKYASDNGIDVSKHSDKLDKVKSLKYYNDQIKETWKGQSEGIKNAKKMPNSLLVNAQKFLQGIIPNEKEAEKVGATISKDFSESLQGILKSAISSLHKTAGNTNNYTRASLKDALLPVFESYYKNTNGAGTTEDLKNIFLNDAHTYVSTKKIPYEKQMEFVGDIGRWYQEYVNYANQIVGINARIVDSQQELSVKNDGNFLNIKSDDLSKIISQLQEILSLMRQVFNIPGAEDMQAKWSAIKEQFNSIAKSDGSIRAAGKGYEKLIDDIRKYQQIAPVDLKDLTGNEKTIAKINKSLASVDKTKATVDATEKIKATTTTKKESTGDAIKANSKNLNDIKQTMVALKEIVKLIDAVSDKMEQLFTNKAFTVGLGESFTSVGEGLSKFNSVDGKKITAVSEALHNLADVPFEKFQSFPGFTEFINDLNRLEAKTETLKSIAEIKKYSKGGALTISEDTKDSTGKGKKGEIPKEFYSENQARWAAERKAELEKTFDYVGKTSISHTSGIVKMTNVVKSADGAWQQLSATMDNTLKVFESAADPMTEKKALEKLGLYSDKEEKQLQSYLRNIERLAKDSDYASIMAKVEGFGGGDVTKARLTAKETSSYYEIEDLRSKINELKNLQTWSGTTQAMLASFEDKINSDIVGEGGLKRIQRASTLFEELDANVGAVIADLNKIPDERAGIMTERIAADYNAYISKYVSGEWTREMLLEQTGNKLAKYKNVVGFYSGADSKDARTAYMKDLIRSRYGDFDYDWSKGAKQPDGKSVERVIAQYRDLNDQVRTVTATIDKSTGAIRIAQTASTQYVNGLDKFFTSLRAKALEGLRYLMAYVSIQDIWRYFRQGVQVVREFDTALTEMRKVSDETLITLKSFQTESFDIADAVGTTALQIQQSTADFMRLGDTLEQAKKNAATANILLNVSEFESIDEATTSLIAMEAAYKNLSGTEIIDKLNNIGNHYAISTDGIATALQVSASALTTAGNDLDESIALITAGNAVLQDPDKVGNGMRTIALRLTGTKAAAQELEEIGEETEGMIQTESKLRKTIMDATKTAKTPNGFDILDESGQYKSTYEILKGIAEIWTDIKELDKERGTTNQNLLLETMAGKNRANILASILQNPDILENVYADSQISEGSAQEELDKYLDSIDARIQKLKNAAQEFAVDFLDSDVIKFFIDFGTSAINVLDELAKKIDFVAVALGGLFSMFLQGAKYPILSLEKNKDTGKWGFKSIFGKIKEEETKNESDSFKNFVKQYQNELTSKESESSTATSSIVPKDNIISGDNKAVNKSIKNVVSESEQKITDTVVSDVEKGTDAAIASKNVVKKQKTPLSKKIANYRQKVRDDLDYVLGGEFDEIDKKIDGKTDKTQKRRKAEKKRTGEPYNWSYFDEYVYGGEAEMYKRDKVLAEAKAAEQYRKKLIKQYASSNEQQKLFLEALHPELRDAAELSGYERTEYMFPKKKKRGSLRRSRKQKDIETAQDLVVSSPPIKDDVKDKLASIQKEGLGKIRDNTEKAIENTVTDTINNAIDVNPYEEIYKKETGSSRFASKRIKGKDYTQTSAFGYLDALSEWQKEQDSKSWADPFEYIKQNENYMIQRESKAKKAAEEASRKMTQRQEKTRADIETKMQKYTNADYWDEFDIFFSGESDGVKSAIGHIEDLHENIQELSSVVETSPYDSSYFRDERTQTSYRDSTGYISMKKKMAGEKTNTMIPYAYPEGNYVESYKYISEQSNKLGGTAKTMTAVSAAVANTTKQTESLKTTMSSTTKEAKAFTKAFDEFIAGGGVMDQKTISRMNEFKLAVASGKEGIEDTYEGFKKWEKDTFTMSKTLGDSIKGIGASIVSTFGSAVISMGVSFLLESAVKGIYYLATLRKQLIQTGQEARKVINDSASATQTANKTIKSLGESSRLALNTSDESKKAKNVGESIDYLAERYTRLKKGVGSDNENVSLTDAEYQEFLNISNQIAEVMPDLQYGTDASGNAILSLGDKAADASKKMKDFYDNTVLLNSSEISSNMRDALRGLNSELEQLEKDYGKISATIDETEGLLTISDSDRRFMSETGRYIQKVSWEDIYSENKDAIINLARSRKEELISLQNEINSLNDTIDSTQLAKLTQKLSEFGISTTKHKDYAEGAMDFGFYAPGDQYYESFVDDASKSEHLFENGILNKDVQKEINNELVNAKKNAMEQIQQLEKYYIGIDQVFMNLAKSSSSYITSSDAFNDLDYELQERLSSFYINDQAHFKELYDQAGEDVGKYENLLIDSYLLPLNELAKGDRQQQIQDLIKEGSAGKTLEAYREYLNNKFKEIFGESYNTNVDYAKLFGFDFKEKELDFIAGRFGGDLGKEIVDKLISERDIADIDLAYKTLWEDTEYTIDTYDKLNKKMEENRNLLAEETSYLSDYTAAQGKANTEKYNTVAEAVAAESANMAKGNANEDYAKLIGRFGGDRSNLNSMFEYGDAFRNAVADYKKELNEVADLQKEASAVGIDYDFNRTLFGNVDTKDTNRLIEWTKDSVKEYKDVLESWGESDIYKSVMAGNKERSTVLGGVKEFNGIPVAYTPILVDDKGARLLNFSDVMGYLDEITQMGKAQYGEDITLEEIIGIDAKGINGIKGLIADIGDSAFITAQYMHFTGAFGSLQGSLDTLLPYLNEMNVSIQTFSEYASMGAINLYSMFELFDDQQRAMTYFTEDGLGIYSFMKNVLDATKDSEELRDAFVDIGKDGVVSFKKNEKHIKKLSERLNISTEAAGYLLDAAKDIGRVSIGTINTQAGSNQLNQFLSDIEAVNAAMSEMSSNGYLSNATITNLVAANGAYASALINTSSGIILNSDAVRELNEQNAELRTAEIQKSEQELTNAYKENTQTIANNLRFGETLSDVYAKLQNEANLSADEAERLNTIWGAYQYNQQIEQDITNLQREQSEIRAIVSLMGEYKTALSSPDLNDNFLTTVSGKEGADKLFEQGWVGQDDFVTYAKLIGHNGDDAATAIRGYQANIERIGKYLTEDRSGVLAFFDDAIAKSEELDSAWVVWDDENGYILDGINNMNEFAEAMGVTTEFAENMVLALHDAGQLDVNLTMITDGIRSDLGAIGTDVLTVNSNLQNLLDRLANVKKSGGEIGGTMIDVAQAIQQSVLNGFDMSETIQKYNEVGGNEWRYNADSDTITTTAENAKAAYDSLTEAVKNYSKAKTEENRQAVRDSLSGFSMFDKDTFDTLKLKTDIDFEKDTKGDIKEKLMKEVFGLNQGDILRITAGIDLPENASEKAYELVEKLQELDGMYVDPEVSTEEIDTASGEARKLAMELLEMGDQETLIALGFDLNEDGFVLVNEIREKLSKEKVDIPATVYVSEQTATSVSQLQTVLQEVATVHEGEVIIEDEDAQETVDTLAQTILDTTSEEQLIKLGVEMKGEKYTKEDIINYYGLNGLEANVPVGLSGLNGNNVDVHVNVPGAAEGAQEVTALNRALTSLGAKGAISVSIDTGVAQSQVQGLRDTLTALNATVAHPSVYMALAGFYSGEKVVTATLDGLSQKIAQPHVSMEYGAFRGGASDVRSQMSGLNGLSASPTVRINDYASSVLYNIKNLIDSLYSRTITITTVRKNKTEALGSFNSWDTEATGTANAYAGGTPNNTDVAIKHNETALVNELGYESIVRNGKWSLIPGGAHFMNLKKGDIIFNADQTRELIENGRVLSDGGRGKLALASGTVNAYYNSSADTGKKGYADLLKTGGSGRGNTGSGSGSGSGSGNGNSGSSKVASDAKDTAETFDWIEIKIDRLEREIEHFDTILSSTYQSWGSRNSALANEIKKTTEEINVQYKQANNAYKRYIQEANKAANKMTKKQREIYIPAIQNGTINISTIKDESLKENIQNYQEWYEKALDCKYAIDELKESLSALYETAFENTQTWYEEQMENIEVLQNLNKYRSNGYHSSYKEDTWDILTKDVNLAIKESQELQRKLDQSVNSGAIAKYSEAWWDMLTAINEAKLSVYEYEEALLDAIEEHRNLIKERHESSQEYQRNRGSYSGERNYIDEEIKNAKSLISELKTTIAYNVGKNGSSFINSDAYLEQVGRLSDAFNALSEQYKTLIEADQEYYERLIKHNDEFADHTEAIFEGAEAFGEYEAIDKYEYKLKSLTKDYSLAREESAKMEEDLDEAIKSGAIQEGSTEWLEQRIAIEEVRSKMRDYKNDIEETNQKIRELDYSELFDRVIEKMDQFTDKLETINSLIHDEMMYDYDTGKLTETGALAIVLNNNELDTGIQKLQKYVQERQRIMSDYANGVFGKETFDKLMKDVESGINSTLGDIDKSRNSILSIIKDQTKAELDVISKVISKRQEALQKKKDYYTYDRQLQDKNKDIQLLKQQIQALDGVTDAESRAKKARLEAQLDESQRDLDDTVQNHVYEMQTQGLDDLKKKLDEDYEKYVNEISKTTANITAAINTAVETSGQNIEGAQQTLNNTLGGLGADIVAELYADTVTGREFEERINSENTDRIVEAINMAADNLAKSNGEEKTYLNSKTEKSENSIIEELGKKKITDNEIAKYQGTFTIQSAKNTGYVLDISAGSTKNSANAQLYQSNGTQAQQFAFDRNADGTYTIRNIKSGLVLDAKGGGTGNGTNIQQYKANGTDAQKWTIIENSDGSVSFKNVKSGKMLDLSGGKVANKSNIQLYSSNGTDAQKFFLKKLAGGSKGVAKTGRYLTQENGSELLVTKYGLLTPLSKGDGVVPAEMTKKLYDIAMNYDKFDASGFKLPSIEGTVNNKNTVNYTVGDINIAGNTTLTKKDLEQFRTQIVEDVKNAIAADMRKFGYKPALA